MDTPHLSRAPRLRAAAAALLLAVTALAAVLLAAAPAAAHASLLGSDPEDGTVLDAAPGEVVLHFSEDVATSADSVRVLDPEGNRVDTGPPERRPGAVGGGTSYAVPLGPEIADGTYTVAWQVVSTDSHPVAGAFTFSVGAPSETSVVVADGPAEDPAVALLYDSGRYAAYAGYLLVVGAAAFLLLCRPPAARRPLVRRVATLGWALAAGATVALLLLRQPYITGGGIGEVVRLAGITEVVATRTGVALLARLAVLALVAGFLFRLLRDPDPEDGCPRDGGAEGTTPGARGALGTGAVLAAGLAATWSLAEHAASGPQTHIAVPADMLHMAAAAVWLGGLVTLLLLLHRGGTPAVSGAVVRRFSTAATVSVVLVAVTGVYQSWRQVGDWGQLASTGYGQLLGVKVALVALLLGVGWTSRRWTARLTDAPAPGAGTPEPPAPPADGTGSASAPDDPAPGDPAPDAPGTEQGPAAATGSARTPADPVRAAQLARQQEARGRARRLKDRDSDPVRSGLRRSVLVEAVIAALVLLATTALTTTPPARTVEEAGGAGATDTVGGGPVALELPFDTGGENGAGTVLVDITPGSTGDNELHIRTVDAAGEPLPAAELRVALTLPAEEIGPLRPDALLVDIGHWTLPGVQLPRPGEWEISLTIRTSDIDQVTETDTFPIG
ncbi:copper resistance protein CopC [Streptomyces bohaiensis]|uniref:copper resistance CopC/CopD family protein n=1 Tax=Streptomyces bohaiensis TaxID=1431344 RepID=UPI003B7D2822